MKERVVFQTNVPVTAALSYSDGLNVEGRYGDQLMYSLTDEQVMYVPPIVRDKLIELGIRQSDPFSICKAEGRDGNRRFIEWAVKRIQPEQPNTSHTAHRDAPTHAVAPGATRSSVAGNPTGNPPASEGRLPS